MFCRLLRRICAAVRQQNTSANPCTSDIVNPIINCVYYKDISVRQILPYSVFNEDVFDRLIQMLAAARNYGGIL